MVTLKSALDVKIFYLWMLCLIWTGWLMLRLVKPYNTGKIFVLVVIRPGAELNAISLMNEYILKRTNMSLGALRGSAFINIHEIPLPIE